METLSFPCPGPSIPGSECCEGTLWLATDPHTGEIPERDCPRCIGKGEILLPSRMEVCHRCEGRGVHDHEAFSNGISQDEFREDPDFFDDYRAGVYSVPCSVCRGQNVVPTVDTDRASKEDLEDYYRHLQSESDYRRECEAERRMGA